MYQSYAGKVIDGKPIILDDVALPENADIVITILNDFIPSAESMSRRQGKAIKRFMEAIEKTSEEIFTNEDFNELENNRMSFDRELGL